MKKLVTLVMVLSIASLATAGLSLTPGTSGFTYDSDTAVATFAFIAIEQSIVEADGAEPILTALGASGSLSGSAGYGLIPGGGFATLITVPTYVWEFNVADSVEAVAAGSWAEYTGATVFGAGEGGAWLVAGDNQTILGTLAVVPEPATMALLGLGALVLRRKK